MPQCYDRPATQADRDTWRLDDGVDTDGDELVVVVAFRADVIIVTLM
jgi:hypothetical protein